MSEDKDKGKSPEYREIFGLKIFGIDFGELMRNWLGVSDLSILKDPAQVEALKKRVEEQRAKLKDAQEQLRAKFGDAIRFDYDIKVRSILGEKDEIRIGGGRFFDRLDELARERTQWSERLKAHVKTTPYKRREGVLEPFTEVMEDEGYVEVIAEMPGVEEKEIEVKIQQDRLFISTTGRERTYKAEVALPTKVLEEPLERGYNNGVLKIRLKKSG